MRVDLFDFDLPEDRIALHPAEPRDSARLLVVRPGQKLADRVNIVCIVTHKLAVRMGIKIAYGKTLHLVKHILAQVTKHRCGAFEHQIV